MKQTPIASRSLLVKPLGRKAYGSITHLPGSRLGPGDHRCDLGQARICTVSSRDRHDRILVTEKLDGANTAVVKHHGTILALSRAGYRTDHSLYAHHQMFAAWVLSRQDRFDALLNEGEQLSGEWLALAHGTRYMLSHDPWVVFDGFDAAHRRWLWAQLEDRVGDQFVLPRVLHAGGSLSVEVALAMLGATGFHGAQDVPEGAVWRVERKGQVDFVAKFVRSDKVDGRYLPEITGGDPVWNWSPDTGNTTASKEGPL